MSDKPFWSDATPDSLIFLATTPEDTTPKATNPGPETPLRSPVSDATPLRPTASETPVLDVSAPDPSESDSSESDSLESDSLEDLFADDPAESIPDPLERIDLERIDSERIDLEQLLVGARRHVEDVTGTALAEPLTTVHGEDATLLPIGAVPATNESTSPMTTEPNDDNLDGSEGRGVNDLVEQPAQGAPVELNEPAKIASPDLPPPPRPADPTPSPSKPSETTSNSTTSGKGDRRTKSSEADKADQPTRDPWTDAAPLAPIPLTPPPVTSQPTTAHARMLRSRERQAEASSVPEGELERAIARDRFERRMANIERLYTTVDRILGFISQDTSLQTMIGKFELTRDPVLDREQRRNLEEALVPRLLEARVQIDNPLDSPVLFDLVYDELIGISVVGDLWRDETVDEILVDAWDTIVVERHGRLEDTGYRFRSPEHAQSVARQLSQLVSDRGVSRTNPLPTALLPSARIQFAGSAVARSGLAIAIRKFKPLLGMDQLLELGALDDEMRDFLAAAVAARATVLVAGGTGTGKTTMINALSEFIPDSERVITIEQVYELSLSNRHVVALQTKERASGDDTIVIDQEELLIASLRMRPDRIIVGEMRDPSGAAVMLQAANTGHDGTMTTIHASNTTSALNNRLTSLLVRSGSGFSDEVARSEIATAFDLVVQITRHRFTGQRFVSEIALVDPSGLADFALIPLPLFVGELAVAADSSSVTFRRANALLPGSDLDLKLRDAGIDTARWTAPLS